MTKFVDLTEVRCSKDDRVCRSDLVRCSQDDRVSRSD